MVTMLSTSRFLRPVSVSVFTLTPLAHKHTHTHTLICLHSSNPAQRSTCAEVCSAHLSVVQQWTVQHSVTRWHNVDLERTVGLSNGDGWNSARLTLTDGILFFFFYNSESHCWSFIDEYILSVFDIDFTAKTELEAQEKQLSDTQKM